MKVKDNLSIVTDDFYYDLFEGGYIDFVKILENKEDIDKVKNAIKVINDFKNSCEPIMDCI